MTKAYLLIEKIYSWYILQGPGNLVIQLRCMHIPGQTVHNKSLLLLEVLKDCDPPLIAVFPPMLNVNIYINDYEMTDQKLPKQPNK